MDSALECVIARFPELTASIQDRFHDDQTFREMCDDYAETLKALQRWQASDVPKKAARIAEYRELAQALEIEIARVLPLPT